MKKILKKPKIKSLEIESAAQSCSGYEQLPCNSAKVSPSVTCSLQYQYS